MADRHASVLCADCREKADVGRLWRDGGEKFRMVWTDPPYGVDYAGKNEYLNRGDRGQRIQKRIEGDTAEAGPDLAKNALITSVQHGMPGAGCYVASPQGPMLGEFIQAMAWAGYAIHEILIWVKQQFSISMLDYHYRHEPILYGWLRNAKHYFIGDRTKTSVFEVDKPHVSDLHAGRPGGKKLRHGYYLTELAHKPKAVRQMAPELVPELGEPWGTVWQLLGAAHGEREAARVLARLLGAVCAHGEERVSRALAAAVNELSSPRDLQTNRPICYIKSLVVDPGSCSRDLWRLIGRVGMPKPWGFNLLPHPESPSPII